jgi:hypothetical protein
MTFPELRCWIGGSKHKLPLQSSNEPRVMVELVLLTEVVELSRCNSFVLSDSSVLELEFSEWSNLWNLGLWRQVPWTSLHLLIAKWGVMRVSLMIAYHFFNMPARTHIRAHRGSWHTNQFLTSI